MPPPPLRQARPRRTTLAAGEPPERTFLGAEPYAELYADLASSAAAGAEPGAADASGAPFMAVPPGPALRPYVARLHVCREHVPTGDVVHERVLPDGAMYLQVHFGDVPRVVDAAAAGDGTAAPEGGGAAEVAGAAAAAAVVRLAGRVEGVSVELRPGAALALLGVPAGDLAGRSLRLETLWGTAARAVLEQVAAAPHGPARAAALERALAGRLASRLIRRDSRRARREDDGARIVARVLRRIADTGGRVAVRDLAAGVGLSERRVEQLFHTHVGLTPKVASRLARFQASVRLARRAPALGWSDVAFACGYADQAHLAHEYQAIAGLTPGAFRARVGGPADFGFPQDAPAARR